jgi:hypothetical protein
LKKKQQQNNKKQQQNRKLILLQVNKDKDKCNKTLGYKHAQCQCIFWRAG